MATPIQPGRYRNQLFHILTKPIVRKIHPIIFFILLLPLFVFQGCESQNTDTEVNLQEVNEIVLSKLQMEEADIKLGEISQQTFQDHISANGYIELIPDKEQLMSSYFGGRLIKVTVAVGQKVAKGAVVAIIENPEFIEMQQAYLESRFLQQKLKQAWERKQSLASENIISASELQQAEAEYLVASARINALSEKLKLLKINPEKLTAFNISAQIAMQAEMSGHVSKILARTGQWLNPEDIVLTIINTEYLRLKLDVFEKDAIWLKPGLQIEATLPENRNIPFKTTVNEIGKQIDTYNRTVNVYANLKQDEKYQLMPGMFMNSRIYLNGKQLPALPESASIESEGGFYVLILKNKTADSWTFVRKRLVVGQKRDGFIEIQNSREFSSDAQFIITGAFQLLQETD